MYKIITEGKTHLYVPVEGAFGKRASGKDKKPPVFYNPHMALNRGLCVLFMRMAGKGLVFADMLAGGGAKGLRVAVESENRVFLNDANKDAVEIIKKSAELNRIEVTLSNMDANRFVLENKRCFDFIDIDPFGSPAPFIDSALLSLKKTGYLGITATDTATLCGVYPETCFRRYQALPLRSEFCHEVGLRILIGNLARTAAKYERGIKPLLSHSTRHYLRFYAKVKSGVKVGEDSLLSMGYLYYCMKCRDFTYKKGRFPSEAVCGCGGKMKVSGPLWLGDMHDSSILVKMLSLSQSKEEKKLLEILSEEVKAPFYHNIHKLAKNIKATPPKIEIILNRLREKGFEASRTHFSPVGVKTNAPIEEVKKSLS
jgi:tRNA (guanine26-N2/guanine27-N2)-dimethyltransferase